MNTNIILQGDALTELKKLPNESINCCMTSPPYWALRDYGTEVETIWDEKESSCKFIGLEHEWDEGIIGAGSRTNDSNSVSFQKESFGSINRDKRPLTNFCKKCGAWKGQLGLEPTFDLYIKHLCDIFDEVKRVLRKDGTCWVNMGDTYSATRWTGNGQGQPMNKFKDGHRDINPNKDSGLEDKNLCIVPFRFAIEMQNRGWILRNVLIWHKPNCMPSSVKDRFTVDFEYLFFFVKNKKYFFETQYEPSKYEDRDKRRKYGYKGKIIGDGFRNELPNRSAEEFAEKNCPDFRNKRAVWTITTKPFKEAHFATYPEELCEVPIKAGCPEFVCNKCGKAREVIDIKIGTIKVPPIGGLKHSEEGNSNINETYSGNTEQNLYKKELSNCNCNAGFSGGIVLDPFFGAGTTGLVALKQNKKFIGIELNPEYIKIAENRLKPFLEQGKLI